MSQTIIKANFYKKCRTPTISSIVNSTITVPNYSGFYVHMFTLDFLINFFKEFVNKSKCFELSWPNRLCCVNSSTVLTNFCKFDVYASISEFFRNFCIICRLVTIWLCYLLQKVLLTSHLWYS